MAGPFTPETYQSGDGNLSEPITVGRLGQPVRIGGGTEWQNIGSGPIADRPSAADFGAGTWQDGTNTYISDGVAWSAPGFSSETTVFDQSRPVSMPLTFTAAPSQLVTQTTDYHGLDLNYNITNANVNPLGATPTKIYAAEFTAQYSGTGDLASLVPCLPMAINSGSGNVGEIVNIRLYAQNTGTGKVTTVYGISMDNPNMTVGGGTAPDNVYGLYIPSLTAGTVSNYAIYTGVGKVHFGDVVETVVTSATSANSVSQAGTGGAIYVSKNGAGIGVEINQLGAGSGLKVASAAGAAGLYNTQLLGQDYGLLISTATNSGQTLSLAKNGTSGGVVLNIANKGIGDSIVCTDGTNKTFTITPTGIPCELAKEIVATDALTVKTITKGNTYLTGTAGASFAVTLPAASILIDGMKLTIMSVNTRGTVTWASTGATGGFIGLPSTLTANTPIKIQYDNPSLSWLISA